MTLEHVGGRCHLLHCHPWKADDAQKAFSCVSFTQQFNQDFLCACNVCKRSPWDMPPCMTEMHRKIPKQGGMTCMCQASDYTSVSGVTWPIFQFRMACVVTIIFFFRNRWGENTQKKRNIQMNLKTTEFKFQWAPSFIGPCDTDCIITELLNYNGSFSSWNRNLQPAKPKACAFKGQRNCMFIFAPGK